jgi:pre-mRNA-splicing helicase BRR2
MFNQQHSVKKITTKNVMHGLRFKQMFTQGIYEKENPLMQLPHFNTDVLKKLSKKRQDLKLQGKNDIHSFIRLPMETIKEFDLFDGDKEKQLDLEAVVRFLPKVKFSVRVYTEIEDPEDSTKHIENETKLHASDLLKIEMRVEYEDLAMDDMEGYVWSRNFPYLKRHGWNIMMVDAKTGERVVMNEHKVRFEDKFAKPGKDDTFKVYDGSIYHIFKQRFGQPGQFEFKCHFISDSYIGLDGECPVVIKTIADPVDFKEP